jgi:AraC-like DNA-binding protein
LWVHVVPNATARRDARILPDGRIDIVWTRGVGALVAGPQSHVTLRPVVAPLVAYGARFHPGAAPVLLRLPASDFVNEHVPLSAVDGGLAARLGRALEAAEDDQRAFAALNRELARAIDGLEPDPAVREAVALLARRSGSVADIAASVFLSERQLERRFREHVGYGPKALERVLRLQRVVRELDAPPVELASAAALAGYADQSHLTRESRRLTGLTPSLLVDWIR